MSLFGKKESAENAQLREQIADLEKRLSPEQGTLYVLEAQIAKAKTELETCKTEISNAVAEHKRLQREIQKAGEDLIETRDEHIFQQYALYHPKYVFNTVDEYKEKLKELRDKEKDLIRKKQAVTGAQNWTVNNSASQGAKMVADMQKLLLRAFNAECDHIIDHITVANIEASDKKMTASYNAISDLGKIMKISISWEYFNCKRHEMYLALDYQQRKQEEKEALREARAQQREEAKLAKELADERKKLEKEQKHYLNALSKMEAQLASADEADRAELEIKVAEAKEHLKEIDAEFASVDYRAANQKAGYVYIISNIGAFGEDVYKIGMTRRLEPMDRIDELGDASVPFDFDVHALIFSDNAPALEAALHNAFADKKLNFVNQRREFFHVSLDEIKRVVKENYDKTVEFIDYPAAEQFRQSLSMRHE